MNQFLFLWYCWKQPEHRIDSSHFSSRCNWVLKAVIFDQLMERLAGDPEWIQVTAHGKYVLDQMGLIFTEYAGDFLRLEQSWDHESPKTFESIFYATNRCPIEFSEDWRETYRLVKTPAFKGQMDAMFEELKKGRISEV